MKKTTRILKTILFYVLSFTWGLPLTSIGLIVSLGLLITGHKPHRFYHAMYFVVGKNWGGLEIGPFFIVCENSNFELKAHEMGHGLQNIILGPLTPFVVSIPSAVRYWLREMRGARGRELFSKIFLVVTATICVGLGVVGYLFWKPLTIIMGILLAYFIGIFLWLQLKEMPKYKDNHWPAYDSVWFEGNATSSGIKLANKYDAEGIITECKNVNKNKETK